MKILYVTPFYPPCVGGISTHVNNISNQAINAQHEVFVICPQRGLINNESSRRIHRIPSFFLPPWPYPTLNSISIPLDLGSSIEKYIKKAKPDIIHIHGHHYPLSWIGIKISSKYGIPNVLTLHGMYALNPSKVEGQTKIEELFNKTVFKYLLAHTSAVIGLTDRITNYARSFGKNQKTTYHTIPNGIETLPFKLNINNKNLYRKKYGIRDHSIVILFRGRFEEVKGIIEFCKAAVKILDIYAKNVEIIIVGDGSLKNHVNTIVNNKPLIHVFEWQPISLIHELYISADIFVIPSKFEALPITIVEAMNAGLHIVYTPVGGIEEILQAYSNKTKIKESNAENIYDCLDNIISNSANIQADSDSQRYAESLDWSTVFNKTLKVYQSLIE